MGRRTGIKTLQEYAQKFGLGESRTEMAPEDSAATAVRGLKVEPGAYRPMVARTRLIEKDSAGNTVSQEWRKKPEPGDNVVLTMDITLQATTEDLLPRPCPAAPIIPASSGRSSRGRGVFSIQPPARQEVKVGEDGEPEPVKGMAAAVVDMSGGVLALASYPTYDLASFRENYNQLQSGAVLFDEPGAAGAVELLLKGQLDPLHPQPVCVRSGGGYHLYLQGEGERPGGGAYRDRHRPEVPDPRQISSRRVRISSRSEPMAFQSRVT